MRRRSLILGGLASLVVPSSIKAEVSDLEVRDAIAKVCQSPWLLFRSELGKTVRKPSQPGMVCFELHLSRTELGEEFFSLCEKNDLPGIVEFSRRSIFR